MLDFPSIKNLENSMLISGTLTSVVAGIEKHSMIDFTRKNLRLVLVHIFYAACKARCAL